MEVLTVCLLLPGNIERAMVDVQRGLFARTGLASAMALPPLVPLAFLPPENAGDRFHAALEGLNSRFTITGSGYVVKSGALFLDAVWDDAGLDVRRRLAERLGEPAAAPSGCPPVHARQPRPFPPYPGILLGAGLPIDLRPPVEPPRVRFSSFWYALIRIASTAAAERWWENCYWQVEERIRSVTRGPHRAPGSESNER